MLDIAIPQPTGYPAKFSEQCICPEGYEGLSCESCARGYFRDDYDRAEIGLVGSCKPCKCSGNERSCTLLDNGKLKCNCLDGFEGTTCEREKGDNFPTFHA